MSTYTARICWNSKGWRYPTGEAAKEGGGSKYVSETGFGHEEWLLDFSRHIDGWHYAFIQGVNQSRNEGRCLAGETIRVTLFTVSPRSEHLRIGHIERCEVLTDKQCADAVTTYRRRGWIEEMAKEVEAIGGTGNTMRHSEEPCWIFNVRFRKEDFVPISPCEEFFKGDWLFGRNYYVLAKVPENTSAKWRQPSGGTRGRLKTDPIKKPSQSGTTYDPVHNRLQNLLRDALRPKYGDAVILEKGGVDVQVDHPDLFVYIEVKSSPDARMAVREALGQVLEYAYYPKGPSGRTPRLFVAAPGKRTPLVEAYLAFLKRQFRLNIEYLELDLTTDAGMILAAVAREASS